MSEPSDVTPRLRHARDEPLPIGSTMLTKMIGIVAVAALSSAAATELDATITSAT